ncbi:MAG: hypothetical protein HGB05_03000 [Chloroflexi bacterium]|nr:hypothetical protein [Chloroflexota bacterium]
MRKSQQRFWLMLVIVALLALTVSVAAAQTGGGYDLTWSTIDGGGGSASGGSYTLDGTIGQFDAGVMSGGAYTLSGGFWGGPAALAQFKVYLLLILK